MIETWEDLLRERDIEIKALRSRIAALEDENIIFSKKVEELCVLSGNQMVEISNLSAVIGKIQEIVDLLWVWRLY